MKNWKKVLGTAVMAVGAVGLLAACGSSDKAANKDKSDTVTVWAWDKTFNIKAMEEAVKVYDNKKVKVKIVEMTQDDIVQKLTTQLTSGSKDGLPDIVLVEDYRIQGFLKTNADAFEPLTDIVKEKDFAAYKFGVNKIGDKIYGVPFDSGVTGLFYRSDYLSEAGYTQEQMNNLTWDDYIKVARDVKAKTGHNITELNPSDLGRVRIMMQEAGEWYTDKDNKVSIAGNKSLAYGMGVLSTLLKEKLVTETSDWATGIKAINGGVVASTPQGSWYSSTVKAQADQSGKWRIAKTPALPAGMGKAQASNSGGAQWYVLKGGATKDAKDFLSKTFATNTDLMATLAKEIGLISTMKSAINTEAYKTGDDFYGGQKVREDFATWTTQIPQVNYGQNTYQIESIMAEYLQQVVKGKDINDALKDAQKRVESEIQ